MLCSLEIMGVMIRDNIVNLMNKYIWGDHNLIIFFEKLACVLLKH